MKAGSNRASKKKRTKGGRKLEGDEKTYKLGSKNLRKTTGNKALGGGRRRSPFGGKGVSLTRELIRRGGKGW